MQLNKNKYFKKILVEENSSEFVIATELRNPDRHKVFTFSFEDISLDITRQLISSKQFTKLKMLGRAINIEAEKKKLFDGSFINITEGRRVTHFLERKPRLLMDKAARYNSLITHLKQKKIKSLINVGIGGSDLGVKMVYNALKHKTEGPSLINISNLDFTNLQDILKKEDTRGICLLYTSPSPRDRTRSRMPSSA